MLETSTETRFVRVILIALGAAAALYLAVLFPTVTTQSAFVRPAWMVGAVSIAFAVPILTGVAAAFSATVLMRIGLVVFVAGFPLATLSLDPALASGALPPEVGASWILGITAMPATAAALLLRPVATWLYSLLLAALVVMDRILDYPGAIADVALQDGLVALLLQTVFASLTLASIRAAHSMDVTSAALREEAVATARARARAAERSRADALLHDTVLASLLEAARAPDSGGNQADSTTAGITSSPRTRAADLARRGLEQIDRATRPDAPGSGHAPTGTTDTGASEVSHQELVRRTQTMVTAISPFADFVHVSAPHGTVPRPAAEALVDAAAEALRNSMNHAGGDEVTRSVVVDVRARAVHIAVLDDGAGFDPDSVGAARLGLRLSVVERMASVQGGEAVIQSRPGSGSSVILIWSAEPPARSGATTKSKRPR